MISGATVVYLSATDWDAPWHGPQEVALRLGRAGNRVLYVETLGWRRPRLFDARRVAGRLARAVRPRADGAPVAPGVALVSPLLIPGARSASARAANRRLLTELLKRRLGERGRGPLVLWIYTPSPPAVELVGALGEDLALYHCTQGHAHRPLAPPGTAEQERRLMARVGLVVVDGILLYRERVGQHPYVYRIPSGVNPEQHAAARAPDWAADLRRPVIGYMGTLGHRIDPKLLAAVARHRPDATVVAVGQVVDADVTELAGLPNVVMLGHRPVAELPGVLAAFDVGVMPYADQPMTRYTYPAKLHQYLASGLPIASTPLPDIAELGDLVEVGSGPSGFAAAVDRALAGPRRAAERRAVAARNTWDDRLRALSAVVEGHLAGRPPSSSDDFRA